MSAIQHELPHQPHGLHHLIVKHRPKGLYLVILPGGMRAVAQGQNDNIFLQINPEKRAEWLVWVESHAGM